jgi:hypothetical protein
MKIKNKQAIDIINTFESMGDKILPRKLSYAIIKNADAMRTQIYAPYEKELEKIRRQHFDREEDGNIRRDKNGNPIIKNPIAFNNDIQELLNIENEFEPHRIPENLLDQCEKEEKYSMLTVRETQMVMKILEE